MRFIPILVFAIMAQSLSVLPRSDCDQIVTHGEYTLCYSEDHEQARWVSYHLTVKNLMCKGRRKNNFKMDPKIPTHSASPVDYMHSGYDRGHLAPAADFGCNPDITFFMSNMSPQKPRFNRGIWKRLENLVREKVLAEGEVYVITGPVLTDSLEKIGPNGISVPELFYKIVFNRCATIAFLIPNKGTWKKPRTFIVSVDSVESLTGIDFLPNMQYDAIK